MLYWVAHKNVPNF